MIKTVALEKIFRTEEVETLALNKVSIEVKEGEFVAIMGPSGCGKSTLLNILGLLDNPTTGEYYLNGIEVSQYTEAQRTKLRKGIIGFVFQSFNLIDELNVYENIELPLLYMGVSAAERKKKVQEAMERMAIVHREKHFPQQLSGGQQQRVAIARAVVANPKLILADEPTGALDRATGRQVMSLFHDLNDEGRTIIMITHDIEIARHARRDFVTARHPALSVRAAIVRINTQKGEELWRAVFGPAARAFIQNCYFKCQKKNTYPV